LKTDAPQKTVQPLEKVTATKVPKEAAKTLKRTAATAPKKRILKRKRTSSKEWTVDLNENCMNYVLYSNIVL